MSATVIVFWIVFSVLLISLLFVYNKEAGDRKMKTADISFDAMIAAIILLMGFVPQIGYITIVPGLSLTLLHIPVILGASIKGRRHGLFFGAIFGLTSCLQAIANPIGLNFFFVYPWISFPPRMLFGYLCGLFFELMRKNPRIGRKALLIGGVSFLSTCLHTVLVFGDLLIFYSGNIIPLFTSGEKVSETLSLTFVGLIGVGMCGEALLAGIIVPALKKALNRALPNLGENGRL